MTKSKAKKSFVEQYEVKAAAILITISAIFSYSWWHLDAADAFLNFPWVANFILLLVAAFTLYLLHFAKTSRKKQSNWLRALTHGSAFTLGLLLFWDWFNWLHLDSNWYRERTFFTGQIGITFLILSLTCTPLITLFGWSALNALKKPLGNYSFIFIIVHLFLFTFDYSFLGEAGIDVTLAIKEAILKQYALLGLVAFTLLIPLAATSNKWSQKKLGKQWKSLHRVVYLIAILASVHYIWVWLSKLALVKPISFALIIALLLLLRTKKIKTAIRNYKRKRRSAQRATT